jgi:hypothetical protein
MPEAPKGGGDGERRQHDRGGDQAAKLKLELEIDRPRRTARIEPGAADAEQDEGEMGKHHDNERTRARTDQEQCPRGGDQRAEGQRGDGQSDEGGPVADRRKEGEQARIEPGRQEQNHEGGQQRQHEAHRLGQAPPRPSCRQTQDEGGEQQQPGPKQRVADAQSLFGQDDGKHPPATAAQRGDRRRRPPGCEAPARRGQDEGQPRPCGISGDRQTGCCQGLTDGHAEQGPAGKERQAGEQMGEAQPRAALPSVQRRHRHRAMLGQPGEAQAGQSLPGKARRARQQGEPDGAGRQDQPLLAEPGDGDRRDQRQQQGIAGAPKTVGEKPAQQGCIVADETIRHAPTLKPRPAVDSLPSLLRDEANRNGIKTGKRARLWPGSR